MAKRVVHYLGTPFARQTACGRFASTLRVVETTDDLMAVTCANCKKVI